MAPILAMGARFIGKQIFGKGLAKGSETFLKKGGKEAIGHGTDVFKKAGIEGIKTAIKKGDTTILKDAFSVFMKKGGKEALGKGFDSFVKNGGIGDIAKMMSKSAFGMEIPGIGALGNQFGKSLLSGGLGPGSSALWHPPRPEELGFTAHRIMY